MTTLDHENPPSLEEEMDSEMESGSESASEAGDSDEEILAAIRSGAIQPGSLVKSHKLRNTEINNVAALKQYVAQTIELINRPTIKSGAEKQLLDDFAEFPCVTIVEDEKREASAEEHAQKIKHNLANDDFKREALFAMEAKSSVLKAYEQLQKLDIPVGRPDDFYAEMAKNDKHMEKVKSKIIKKKDEQDRREKLRKLRDQRKHGKEVQNEVKKKRALEKQEFQKKLKRARKNKTGDALFEDDEGRGGKAKRLNAKRDHKDQKFGKAWGDKLHKAGQNSKAKAGGGGGGQTFSKGNAFPKGANKKSGGGFSKGPGGKGSGLGKGGKKAGFAPKGTGRHPSKLGKSSKPNKRPGKAARAKGRK